MRKLSLITLIFLYSCSKEIDLRGDWMPIEFMNNGTITNELKNFPNTYIRNDNIIIYFDHCYVSSCAVKMRPTARTRSKCDAHNIKTRLGGISIDYLATRAICE